MGFRFAASLFMAMVCLGTVLGMPVAMLKTAGSTSYITTRNTTTYQANRAQYCDAGFCGQTGFPQHGCPWAQPHCPAGWTVVDTTHYEETAGCAVPYSDMACVATCVTSAVCGSP